MEVVPHATKHVAYAKHDITANIAADRQAREEMLIKKRKRELADLIVRRDKAKEQFHEFQEHCLRRVGNNALDLPSELGYDIVAQLTSCCKVQDLSTEALAREVSKLQIRVREEQSVLEVKLKEAENVKDVTGYTPARPDFGIYDADKLKEMDACATRVASENHQIEIILGKKKPIIKKLLAEIEKRKKLHEKTYVVCNETRVVDREIAETQREIDHLRRHHEAEDRAVMEVVAARDVVPVESLTADKEALKDELEHANNDMRHQQRVMHAQRFRIDQLASRFAVAQECFKDVTGMDYATAEKRSAGGAAASNGGAGGLVVADEEEEDADAPCPPLWTQHLETIVPAEETVPAVLYELVKAAYAKVDSGVALKEIINQERTLTVDSLNHKVDLLLARIKEDERERIADAVELEQRMEKEREELEATETYIREGLDALNRDNARLRKDVQQRTAEGQ